MVSYFLFYFVAISSLLPARLLLLRSSSAWFHLSHISLVSTALFSASLHLCSVSLCFPSVPDLFLVDFCFLSTVFVLHLSFSSPALLLPVFVACCFYSSHFQIFGFRLQCSSWSSFTFLPLCVSCIWVYFCENLAKITVLFPGNTAGIVINIQFFSSQTWLAIIPRTP